MSIFTDLESMTDEEKLKLAELLANITPKATPSPKKGRPKASVKKKKAKKKVIKQQKKDSGDQTDEPEEQLDEVEIKKPSKNQQGRSESRLAGKTAKTKGTRRDKGGGGKGAPCSTQAISLSGQNDFLKMSEKNSAKEDSKIDKLLWKNRRPADRREEFIPVEAQCQVCNRFYDVNPALLYNDPDDGIVFTCNKCTKRGR